MLVVFVAHAFHPPTQRVLEFLGEVKADWGWIYSCLAAIVAGAVIPEVLRFLWFQRGRWNQENLRELGFSVPFWGVMGTAVDFFYRWQVIWFGDEAAPSVVVPQVVVDQFIYNPLFAAPVSVCLYEWKNSGYRWRRELLTARFYRERVVPVLFATWGVWIPLVTVLYLLPEPVQTPLFALALSLWVLILSWMAREGKNS
jgi:hypothetical protein